LLGPEWFEIFNRALNGATSWLFPKIKQPFAAQTTGERMSNFS
jgi:hypothetical protein